MEATEGQLKEIEDIEFDPLASLPKSIRNRVNALKNFQDKHAEVEAKFKEEVLQLEKKYLTLYQPLYEQRFQIVSGKVEATTEQSVHKDDEEEEAVKEPVPEPETAILGIPNFWLNVLRAHPQIGELITEKDSEALKSLVDIKQTYIPDNS
ncbi:hypothetical protein HK096_006339, partial [Nowakowskiella sp. JEL0078]